LYLSVSVGLAHRLPTEGLAPLGATLNEEAAQSKGAVSQVECNPWSSHFPRSYHTRDRNQRQAPALHDVHDVHPSVRLILLSSVFPVG
jgi:hypothetical protein